VVSSFGIWNERILLWPIKPTHAFSGIKVKETFDDKLKSSLPDSMKAAAEKMIDSSSTLTTKKPSDKNAKGFSLGGNLSLKKNPAGAECKVEILLAYWPKVAMFGSAKGSGRVKATGKALDGAIEDFVTQIVEEAIKKQAIPELEQRVRDGNMG